ncbi:MAG TPA: phosphatase PAP2 family protein [Jatrophihabitans sp.]|nr:phosphatase PAP2 family protein [Jatrophihabitans sp.]
MSTDPVATPAARRFGVRATLAFIALLIAAVPFGAIVLLLREKVGWLRRLDVGAAQHLHNFDESHPAFVTVMRAITNSGAPRVWIVVLGLLTLWLLVRRMYRLAIFVPVTGLGSSLLNDTIKTLVGRTRPVLENPIATATGKSFPSGHTQSAIVGYGILVLIFLPVIAARWRRWVIALAMLMVLLVGFSRIALGVHYVSDVVGGLLIGGAWLMAQTAAFSAWRRDSKLPPVDPERGLEPEGARRLKGG